MQFKVVKCVNLSVSALGIYDKCIADSPNMLKNLKFDNTSKNYLIRKVTSITIKTSTNVIRNGKVLNSLRSDSNFLNQLVIYKIPII